MSTGRVDVCIIGGGLAGLTLALQLKREAPQASILVVERQRHPVPEAAFKVGESTSETGAHYLREVLGLQPQLDGHQLIKLGLRFFMSSEDNADLARRVEIGFRDFLPARTYQLDRGRFENDLGLALGAAGVEFLDGAAVKDVQLGEAEHVVTVAARGSQLEVACRWVVDASGRNSFLKRRLGLARPVDHAGNAVWFRLDAEIDPDLWSEDLNWRAHVPPGRRRLSTIHLMGRGYWVWLIPLASGATSVGVVADPEYHAFSAFGDYERCLAWLERNEPQAAAVVRRLRDRLLDFRVMRNYAYGCERVYSPERWCLTGEAGVFHDPFYSPGTDLIAIGNTFITDLVRRDLAGEAIDRRIESHNRWFLSTFVAMLGLFQSQYVLMGNPQIMAAKAVWDFLRYWGSIAVISTHRRYCDLAFTARVGSDFYRLNRLDARMQAFFREWEALDSGRFKPRFIDLWTIPLIQERNRDLVRPFDDGDLADRIEGNVQTSEKVAEEIMWRAFDRLQLEPPGRVIDPYETRLVSAQDRIGPLPRPAGALEVAEALAELWLEPEGGPEPGQVSARGASWVRRAR